MDASQLGQIVALVAVATVVARVVMGSVARAGEGMATLFVPPDRTLGWPHGVQEGDEPWGWRGRLRMEGPTPGGPAGDDPGRDGADDAAG
ncbi:MAG TPA: hypothetical protein VK194_05975, partial [Candidatus Deferrimicrobium sp.]|nr:hypothetical protein [Candidatus Deferrimicrobium sp.]